MKSLFVFIIILFPSLASAYTVTPESVSSSLTAIVSSPSEVIADGVHQAIVTVTVKNFSGDALPNKSVSLFNALSIGSVSINPKSTTTNQNGEAIFTISSTTPGEAIIRASVDGSIFETRVQFIQSTACEFASYRLVKSNSNPAVYYYGNDCKRHAFPDEKTYFGWYSDFRGVSVLSENYIAKMPLGKNVTHKPGYRMVKFPSINKVYAVSQGGVLHWIPTEALAEALYGQNGLNDFPSGIPWNKKVDDVSEAFYSNYKMGSDILNVVDSLHTDYNPVSELSNVKTIDDNW